MLQSRCALGAIALVAACAGTSQAAWTNNTGLGILVYGWQAETPGNIFNWWEASSSNPSYPNWTVQMSMKARGIDPSSFNNPISVAGNQFTVQSGMSEVNPGLSAWSLDFSVFLLGPTYNPIALDMITISFDLDPGEGARWWTVSALDLIPAVELPNTAYQNSINYSGGLMQSIAAAAGETYDPWAAGNYKVRMHYSDPYDLHLAFDNEIEVHVIPTPGALALGALTPVATLRRRRRS